MNSIRLTPAVKFLLIAIFTTFVVQQTVDSFFGGHLLETFALIPSEFALHHRFYQLFTYAFLHADVMHVFFNCMMLAFIAPDLEATWGRTQFLKYYFFCSISAGLIYLFVLMFKDTGFSAPMVGASGAIYGVLLAYGLLFGERVMLFMMLFPMKAKHFVWVLAGIEFMTTVFSHGQALAGIAHLGGMAAGFGYMWVRATLSIRRRKQATDSLQGFSRAFQKLKALNPANKRKASRHLKLIIDNARDNAQGKAKSDDDSDPNPKTWH